MFLWCVRDGWRDIYSERGLFPISFSRSQGCQRLDPLASLSETPLIGCMSFRLTLWFSALCLNLTAWFSSHGLLPVTHLLYLSALTCCNIHDSLSKHMGSLGTNRKSMSYCYITSVQLDDFHIFFRCHYCCCLQVYWWMGDMVGTLHQDK